MVEKHQDQAPRFLSSFLRYFIYIQSKHSSLHLVPEHPQTIVFPRWGLAVFTYKNRDNPGHIKTQNHHTDFRIHFSLLNGLSL
jgi:hypothetical protein